MLSLIIDYVRNKETLYPLSLNTESTKKKFYLNQTTIILRVNLRQIVEVGHKKFVFSGKRLATLSVIFDKC